VTAGIRAFQHRLWVIFVRRIRKTLGEDGGPQVYGPATRLRVGSGANLQDTLFNLMSGEVAVGDDVFFGHRCMVLTGTHDVGQLGARRQASIPVDGRDIVIGAGAWIASGAIIIGPCTIGEHAVISAGSVVRGDVEPYVIVSGNPASPVGRVRPKAS
jgi:acetyltransferase-like isoleucine patch superfamily enzyme